MTEWEARTADLLLADDLSGALEVAAAFAAAEAGACVCLPLLGPDGSPPRAACPWDADLLAVSLESRHAPDAAAVAALARPILARGVAPPRVRYLKLDSTLRGAVGAHLAALAGLLPSAPRFLVAPANPAAGRAVRGGVLCVDGVPVADTAFARDPLCPVAESDVAALLRGQGVPDAAHLADTAALADWLREGAARSRVAVADAESEADLGRIADHVRASPGVLPVGSGGLARALAGGVGAKGATAAPAPAGLAPAGPRLYVVGSAHPAARRQAGRLSGEHAVPLFPPAEAYAASRALAARGVALLHAPYDRGDAAAVTEAVAAAAARIVAHAAPKCLYVTGGETAFRVLRALGVSWLRVRAMPEPGLALAEPDAGPAALVAVKPGGFGDDDTLVRLEDRWRREAAAGR